MCFRILLTPLGRLLLRRMLTVKLGIQGAMFCHERNTSGFVTGRAQGSGMLLSQGYPVRDVDKQVKLKPYQNPPLTRIVSVNTRQSHDQVTSESARKHHILWKIIIKAWLKLGHQYGKSEKNVKCHAMLGILWRHRKCQLGRLRKTRGKKMPLENKCKRGLVEDERSVCMN